MYPSTPAAPSLAVRSYAPQTIRNGLRGHAELSRHGGLACILDQIGPLRAHRLQLGFEPRHAGLERVQVPLLRSRQVPSRSSHTLSVAAGRSTKGALMKMAPRGCHDGPCPTRRRKLLTRAIEGFDKSTRAPHADLGGRLTARRSVRGIQGAIGTYMRKL